MQRRLSRTLITLFPQKKDKPHLQIIWMVIKCLAWISRSICVMFSIRGWEIRRVVSWRWGIEYVSGVDDTFHMNLLLQDWVTQSESLLHNMFQLVIEGRWGWFWWWVLFHLKRDGLVCLRILGRLHNSRLVRLKQGMWSWLLIMYEVVKVVTMVLWR